MLRLHVLAALLLLLGFELSYVAAQSPTQDCSYANGGCDPHVNCKKNTNGKITCGQCPMGYTGTGTTRCDPLCGDDICDHDIGENCVSCGSDCANVTCGLCGDGACATSRGESCETCYEDCKYLCDFQCAECSEHGRCVMGSCICAAGYTGPSCSVPLTPIIISANKQTTPIIFITVTGVVFSIATQYIQEVDNSSVVKYQTNLTQYYFTTYRYPAVRGSQNEMWEMSTMLDNQAVVNVTLLQFHDKATNYTFQNSRSTMLSANNLKIIVKVANWPFRSIYNSLALTLQTVVQYSSDDSEECVDSQAAGQSLVWSRLTSGNTSLYMQYQPDAYIDSRIRGITFSPVANSSKVVATMPHFWTSAEFDPTYSVMPGSCLRAPPAPTTTTTATTSAENKNNDGGGGTDTQKIVIAVVVPVMVLAALMGVAYYIYYRRAVSLEKADAAAQENQN